jgi:DNA-binding MarR family transcriptional regulator
MIIAILGKKNSFLLSKSLYFSDKYLYSTSIYLYYTSIFVLVNKCAIQEGGESMPIEKQDTVDLIEYEMATFIRKAVYLEQSEKKIGQLERSAYLLLRQLDEFGPARVKELAEAFKLDISTLSRQAASLEAKHFIQRCSDPNDGRVSVFTITELGKEKLESDKQKRRTHYHQVLADWTTEEKELFAKLVDRLNTSFFE